MKIGSRYLYLMLTKKPISAEKLKQLRDGKAHISKNPVRVKTKLEDVKN